MMWDRVGAKVRFCPLASGSSGNCTLISTEYTNILVDAGLTGKKIEAALGELGLNGKDIDAIFITHEHKDHIKGAGILSRRYQIPIYATAGTWDGMKNDIGEISRSHVNFVYSGENCFVNDIAIRPFDIPHDAAEPVGYSFLVDQIKMTLATDIGHETDTIKENIADSDCLLLEANYDLDKLWNGPYPYYLKKRIAGEKGHLSNETAGNLLTEVITGKLKYVYLGHLSDENNNPHLAYETVQDILEKNHVVVGRDIKMDLANRYCRSCEIYL